MSDRINRGLILDEAGTCQDSGQFPIEVNGHRVEITEPTLPRIYAPCGSQLSDIAFECVRCGHQMVPPENHVEASTWVSNAFDCVECDSDD